MAPAVYLNHAGTSWPKPAPVRAAVEAALAAPPEDWDARLDGARRDVAAALGLDDADRLLLTPGCTSALAVAVADLPWQTGDRVVTSRVEHHALARPLAKLDALGVAVVHVRRAGDAPLDLEALERELRRGGVRLVAITAACNVTGERLPVREVVELAHAHGALALVDAAQVAGWERLDLAAPGADLVAFAGHKGPQAPWGIGGLFVAPTVELRSPSATCDAPAGGPPSRRPCAPMPGGCDVGSLDRVALEGLRAGLAWLAGPAQTDRLARARRQVERLASAVEDLPGVRLPGDRRTAARMPVLALTREGAAPADLARALLEHGVVAAAGLQCAPLAHEALGTAPAGVLRLSAGPQTTDEEIERAAEALRTVLG